MFFFKSVCIFLLLAYAGLTQAESSISYGVNRAASASLNFRVTVPPVSVITKVEKIGDLISFSVFSNNKKPSKVFFVNSQADCYIKDMEIVPQQKVGESLYKVIVPQGCGDYKLWLEVFSL